MPHNVTEEKSTLVYDQVVARYRQATRHYLDIIDPNLCRQMASVTKPQWVNTYFSVWLPTLEDHKSNRF